MKTLLHHKRAKKLEEIFDQGWQIKKWFWFLHSSLNSFIKFLSSIYSLSALPPREQTLNLMFAPQRQHRSLDSSLTYNKPKAFKVSDCLAERRGFGVSAFHQCKTRCQDRHKVNRALIKKLEGSRQALCISWFSTYISDAVFSIWSKSFGEKAVFRWKDPSQKLYQVLIEGRFLHKVQVAKGSTQIRWHILKLLIGLKP